jgi:hypothetical protein
MQEKKAEIGKPVVLQNFHLLKKYTLYKDGKYRGPCPPELREMISKD